MDSYDLIVIGGGNAGQGAAGIARDARWSVAVIEDRGVGGTCPLRGCVPKKVLVAAAEVLDQIARAPAHGIAVGAPTLDWAKLMARKQSFVEDVPEQMEKSLVKRGIAVFHGRARLAGPRSVELDGRTLEARKILVATGSRPRALAIEGGEHAITSDEILELRELPRSLVFVGAGVIGLEFTHVFARAGTKVTILEIAPRPLPALDPDAVSLLAEATRALGVEIHAGVKVKSIARDGEAFVVRWERDGQAHETRAGVVANGAGRAAALDGLGLDRAGITLEKGRPPVDAFLRSKDNPDVYFAGDALPGKAQLSPLATAEGKLAARHMLGERVQPIDYDSIPSVVFTIPPLAAVGLTEERAKEQGLDFDVKVNDIRGWRSARTYAETAAWAKVLIEKGSERILGAHLLGHGAPETIHTFALARAHGIRSGELREKVYAYPTFNSDLKYLV